MDEKYRKVHNAAIKDVLRKIELMHGWTLSRKLTVKAIKSCLLKKQKAEIVPITLKQKAE